jgi:putative ubiquitin-RnfH superfamily antitoxin RatB of RatAB toxin-antitoxin module
MKIEVVRAWPRRFESTFVELPEGSTVADALAHVPMEAGEVAVAVHGLRATAQTALHDGDRVELLRPLIADPKDARRRRAEQRPLKGR